MINKDKIGKWIQLARNNQNMTQDALAEAVGISTNYLSKIERGLNLPNAEIFLNIIQALNLSLEDFGIIPQADMNASKKDLLHIVHACDNQSIEALLPIIKSTLESFEYIKQRI